MDRKIRICHFSGKRGGFGSLTRTLQYLKNHPRFELQIVVSDMHLRDDFGNTQREVMAYVPIDAAVDMRQKGDTVADRAEATGECVKASARVLESLQPDALFVIGDRGEVLGAAMAAVNMNIPVIHLEGGDVTGNLDDLFRHAITKLAHVHLTTNKDTSERIAKMGEPKDRIHIVGDVHLDRLGSSDYTPVDHVREKYGLVGDYAIILQHPDTTKPDAAYAQMNATMDAFVSIGMQGILIYPCTDQGYGGILRSINEHPSPNIQVHKNIDAPDFLGLLSGAAFVLGNSSSGIKEAPFLGVPSINVGLRQHGRHREASVIDVPEADPDKIREAIRLAMDPEWRRTHASWSGYYGDGKTAERIIAALEATLFDTSLFTKRMTY